MNLLRRLFLVFATALFGLLLFAPLASASTVSPFGSAKLTPSTIAIITAVGSLVVPPVVSFLKRERWSAQVKQLLAGVLSVAVAAVAIAITARADFGLPFLQLAGFIYAGSQLVYGAYFKGSLVDSILTAIGKKPAPVAAQK